MGGCGSPGTRKDWGVVHLAPERTGVWFTWHQKGLGFRRPGTRKGWPKRGLFFRPPWVWSTWQKNGWGLVHLAQERTRDQTRPGKDERTRRNRDVDVRAFDVWASLHAACGGCISCLCGRCFLALGWS